MKKSRSHARARDKGQVTIALPAELLEKLTSLAKATDRNRNNFIVSELAAAVTAYENAQAKGVSPLIAHATRLSSVIRLAETHGETEPTLSVAEARAIYAVNRGVPASGKPVAPDQLMAGAEANAGYNLPADQLIKEEQARRDHDKRSRSKASS